MIEPEMISHNVSGVVSEPSRAVLAPAHGSAFMSVNDGHPSPDDRQHPGDTISRWMVVLDLSDPENPNAGVARFHFPTETWYWRSCALTPTHWMKLPNAEVCDGGRKTSELKQNANRHSQH